MAPGHAQTASQITPSSVRPLAAPAAGGIAIPDSSGPLAPSGVEALTVRLAGVDLSDGPDGAAAAVVAARDGFVAALAGKTVTVAAIFAAARDLEGAYGRAGLILTRVVVPAQRLVNGGRLKVTIIAGFIERLETKDVPPLVRARIVAILAPLVGSKSLRLNEVERALVLAGDTPGTVLKSTLARGSQPGGSILVVEARHKLVTGSLSVDTNVGASLGGVSTTLALQLNSALGAGEQVYGQASGYPNLAGGSNGIFAAKPTNRQLAAGAVMPLGTDGLSFNLEAIRTDSAPDPSAGQQFYSVFERVSGRLKYAFERSRAFNVSSELAFDAEQETLSALSPTAAPVSLDRLRVLRDTTEVFGIAPWGAFMSGRVIGSLGLDALGARDAAAATPALPLSRQGADAHFGKLEVAGHYGQALIEHLGIDLFARAQTSFGKALPRAEQIGLVGGDGITAFDAGTFQGDAGVVGRIEVSSPWTIDLVTGAASLSPYAFGDVGTVWLMQPTALERKRVTAGSSGLGLRLGAAPNPPGSPKPNPLSGIVDQTSLSLEWGHQYRSDGLPAGNRFTLAAAIQF